MPRRKRSPQYLIAGKEYQVVWSIQNTGVVYKHDIPVLRAEKKNQKGHMSYRFSKDGNRWTGWMDRLYIGVLSSIRDFGDDTINIQNTLDNAQS